MCWLRARFVKNRSLDVERTCFRRTARKQMPNLPMELQRELYLTRSPLEERWLAGSSNGAGSGVPDRCVGIVELRRVEYVKDFGTKLKVAGFGLREMKVLEER